MDADKALDVAGKVVDLASDFGKFLDKVLGPPATEAGGMLGQQIRFWREMQLLKLSAKFDAELRRRGLSYADLKSLPLGQSVPLIEAASMEESDEVQVLWAGLLASAMDPASGISFKKVFVGLLREIGPTEAALLDLLWKLRPHQLSVNLQNKSEIEAELNMLAEQNWRKFSSQDQESAISNLIRIGCIFPNISMPQIHGILKRTEVAGGRRSLSGRSELINSVDPQKFSALIDYLLDIIGTITRTKPMVLAKSVPLINSNGAYVGNLAVPEMGLLLSPLGLDLLSACTGGTVLD